MRGGHGDDFVSGELDSDDLRGDDGDDVLNGDTFFGNDPGTKDRCDGGSGNDLEFERGACERTKSIEGVFVPEPEPEP